MIITGMDGRNISSVADLLQTKQVVAVLRLAATFPIYRRLLIDAAEEVNKDGFQLTGDDIRIACENFANVVGYRTDMMKSTVQQEQPPVPPPPDDGKKVLVN